MYRVQKLLSQAVYKLKLISVKLVSYGTCPDLGETGDIWVGAAVVDSPVTFVTFPAPATSISVKGKKWAHTSTHTHAHAHMFYVSVKFPDIKTGIYYSSLKKYI